MKITNSTFILFFNLAIPCNEILVEGLGDLLQKERSPEIELLINKFLNKYNDFFEIIETFLNSKVNNNGFNFSDITNQLILIYGKEKYFSFNKDLMSFCAKAYFSNPKVIHSYKLIGNYIEKEDILDPEKDKLIFNSLLIK